MLPKSSRGMLIQKIKISLVLKLNFQHFNLNGGLQEEGEQIPSQTTHSPILMCFVTMAVIDELLALIMSHEILQSHLKTCKRLRHFSCSYTSLSFGYAAGNQPWWHQLQQSFFFWTRNPCVPGEWDTKCSHHFQTEDVHWHQHQFSSPYLLKPSNFSTLPTNKDTLFKKSFVKSKLDIKPCYSFLL